MWAADALFLCGSWASCLILGNSSLIYGSNILSQHLPSFQVLLLSCVVSTVRNKFQFDGSVSIGMGNCTTSLCTWQELSRRQYPDLYSVVSLCSDVGKCANPPSKPWRMFAIPSVSFVTDFVAVTHVYFHSRKVTSEPVDVQTLIRASSISLWRSLVDGAADAH